MEIRVRKVFRFWGEIENWSEAQRSGLIFTHASTPAHNALFAKNGAVSSFL
jgi:hypothetical protein